MGFWVNLHDWFDKVETNLDDLYILWVVLPQVPVYENLVLSF